MPSIRKILIANRGEIAQRIMRTAQRMNIVCVAVFSEADRKAPFVQMADEAYCIGPAPSSQSYLDGEKILAVARESGADAIHPGYGFLSENADFAASVGDSSLIFIGPGPQSIRTMGSKLAAKRAVKGYGIPMVPGSNRKIDDPEEALEQAEEIGFPVLIKASAGGGGKGMRIVRERDAFFDEMKRAVSEAEKAFGDGSVFVEKFITKPKHIEIQVLADNTGNTVHLFERECSVQRRHQKVIEEAPSPSVSPELRKQMGEAATKVAIACGYTGAGTVEFLVDEDRNYYFLEMNTRLQVEHPVTEMITGLDLVEWQIRVARGEQIPFIQEDLRINGHAIELRVYAEDPFNNFLPGTGTLEGYRIPEGPGIRLDDGYRQGQEIPIYYDPLIAKLVAWGPSRKAAIDRLLEAIWHYRIEGVQTTLPFGTFTLQHPDFQAGTYTTHFVEQHFYPVLSEEASPLDRAVAVAALYAYTNEREKLRSISSGSDNWYRNRRNG